MVNIKIFEDDKNKQSLISIEEHKKLLIRIQKLTKKIKEVKQAKEGIKAQFDYHIKSERLENDNQ